MPRSTSLLFALLLGAAAPLAAQCTIEWSSGGPQPQLTGWGYCSSTWDPDGAGPEATRLVVGGQYLGGGAAQPQATVLTWDGSQWLGLGGGPGTNVNRYVQTLTVWNGLLVAGGSFTGGGLSNIALWTGTDWQGLGAGFPVGVQQMTTYGGDLIAISQTGGSPIMRRWDGVAWTDLPPAPALAFPHAAIVYQGHLCVAGSAGSQGVLVRWNGTAWQAPIYAHSAIHCLGVRVSLAVGGTDTLYAGGNFQWIGSTTTAASRIAVTSGGTAFTWSQVGGGLPARCDLLHVRTAGLTGTSVVARINSTTTPMMQLSGGSFVAMGSAPLRSLTYFGGSVHGALQANGAAQRWDGTAWVPLRGPGMVGEVRALTRLGDDMVVGGTFDTASGTTLNRIARWDGTAFSPLGAGVIGSSVDALLTLASGDVVAGGLFLQSGATPLNHIGRWDGTAWSAFGGGMDQQVLALCTMPNGDLIAGGKFTIAGGVPCSRVARWDGSAWSPMGAGMNGDVHALAVRGDGTLFAGGAFTTAGGVACSRVAQWNGTTWLNVGAGTNGDVHGLAVRPGDDVVAVGAFTSAGGLPASRCARWTGASWAAMGAASSDPSPARALCVLPDGDVVAGRGFHPPTGSPDDGISRWNGSAWSGFGNGLEAFFVGQPVDVRAIAQRADGALVVGGVFGVADGSIAHNLAVLSPTCAADAQPYGSGCSSTAGPIVLTADTLPWIDATFRTTTTGVAANALCAGLIGFTPLSIPLATLLPEGQPGCTLLTSPDAIVPLVAGPGTAHLVLPFANDPALIGAAFQQQTIPIEFDPFGTIQAFRASNALALVMGSL